LGDFARTGENEITTWAQRANETAFRRPSRLPRVTGGDTAQRVREGRDRLISATGTRPAFDYELLRLLRLRHLP